MEPNDVTTTTSFPRRSTADLPESPEDDSVDPLDDLLASFPRPSLAEGWKPFDTESHLTHSSTSEWTETTEGDRDRDRIPVSGRTSPTKPSVPPKEGRTAVGSTSSTSNVERSKSVKRSKDPYPSTPNRPFKRLREALTISPRSPRTRQPHSTPPVSTMQISAPIQTLSRDQGVKGYSRHGHSTSIASMPLRAQDHVFKVEVRSPSKIPLPKSPTEKSTDPTKTRQTLGPLAPSNLVSREEELRYRPVKANENRAKSRAEPNPGQSRNNGQGSTSAESQHGVTDDGQAPFTLDQVLASFYYTRIHFESSIQALETIRADLFREKRANDEGREAIQELLEERRRTHVSLNESQRELDQLHDEVYRLKGELGKSAKEQKGLMSHLEANLTKEKLANTDLRNEVARVNEERSSLRSELVKAKESAAAAERQALDMRRTLDEAEFTHRSLKEGGARLQRELVEKNAKIAEMERARISGSKRWGGVV